MARDLHGTTRGAAAQQGLALALLPALGLVRQAHEHLVQIGVVSQRCLQRAFGGSVQHGPQCDLPQLGRRALAAPAPRDAAALHVSQHFAQQAGGALGAQPAFGRTKQAQVDYEIGRASCRERV